MKINITPEWVMKQVARGDEPGGLMACSPEIWEEKAAPHEVAKPEDPAVE